MTNRLRKSALLVLGIGIAILITGFSLRTRLGIPELGIMATLIGAPCTLIGSVLLVVSCMK